MLIIGGLGFQRPGEQVTTHRRTYVVFRLPHIKPAVGRVINVTRKRYFKAT